METGEWRVGIVCVYFRQEAVDMCRKFGVNVYIAGTFHDKEDFDIYYQGLYENEKFIKECSFVDNGRLLTWIPYSRNSDR